jgi:aminoglycoside 6'-N-acetyltransferase I
MGEVEPVVIRLIDERDRHAWVRLRDALWPGSLADHENETVEYFATRATTPIVFVAESRERLVGFLELDFRKYAPGCSSSPVPFVEGWYVEPAFRARGVGRALVEAAEAQAKAEGHVEIASDTPIENAAGLAAHAALGFAEIERVVYLRKALR